MRIDAEVLAGLIGAQHYLDHEQAEGELFYREGDSYVDGRLDLRALVVAILEASAPVRAHQESQTRRIDRLEGTLQEICVKCRSNEWGPLTPRKEILNWMHDTASHALSEESERGPDKESERG